MRATYCIALALAVIAAATASVIRFDSSLDGGWDGFKTAFKKSYASPAHEKARRAIWEQNLRYIRQHNLEADLGRHSYRLGMNEYGDLTNKEYRRRLLGGRRNASATIGGSTYLPPSNVEEPASVDWRRKGYVTHVKNQGQCGSCWAFSATGSMEGQHKAKTGRLVSLSEQNLVDCSQEEGNMGCGGGLMDYAFTYVKKNGGIDTEESYPYEAEDGPCRFKRRNVGARVTGYVDVRYGSEMDLKRATAHVGPISVGIDASHMSFQFYQGGVYDEPDCSSTELDHGVLVVGYGVTRGKAYWLVKNSWGTSWGLSGYILMSRNKDNQCGIASQASFPLM